MFLTKRLSALISGRHRKFNQKVVTRNPNRWWKLQYLLRSVWNRWGRARNCRKFATISLNRGLMFSTINRPVYRRDMHQLCLDRIDAAAKEHGTTGGQFLEGLARSHVNLNSRVLADLAIYEPRTFESLVDVAKKKCELEGISDPKVPRVTNVDTGERL